MGKNYEDLKVWQKAMGFVEVVYRATSQFPEDERFGLTSQLRRAAVSIPSNIAEGAGRSSDKEFIRFLYIARGSVSEVKTQLLIATRLGFITDESGELLNQLDEISRMLNGLRNNLESRDSRLGTRDFELIENRGV